MEQEIMNKGRALLEATKDETMAIFRRDYWNGKIMEWSMKNRAFKVNMFRFVDVLPVLEESSQVAEHLKEYFSEGDQEIPSVLKWGIGSVGATGLTARLAAGAIQKNITQMARMFITGTDADEAVSILEKMRKNNLCFTVDILGEAVVSEKEAADYQNRYIQLFRKLSEHSRKWDDHPLLDFDHTGKIPKTNVSVKLSSLYSQINVADFETTATILKDRLRPVMSAAVQTGSFINLDMEQFALKDLTYKVFTSLLEEDEFRSYPHVGIVVQAYLRSSEEDLKGLIKWCKQQKRSITIRLVKGAYWDYEVIRARQMDWPIPVYTVKSHSDANYEKLTKLLFENHEWTRPALGTHNLRSLSHALVLAEKMKLPQKLLEVQMLYGMAEPIKKAVTSFGIRCRDYAPVGELLPGMAYLVRRLLENTSNESFLRLKYMTDTPLDVLLRTPAAFTSSAERESLIEPTPAHDKSASVTREALRTPFTNMPLLDFTVESNRAAYASALKTVERQLGKNISPRVNGRELNRDKKLTSKNPCLPQQAVAVASCATAADATAALESAFAARKRWADTPVEERALMLLKAAALLRKRRFEICAWESFETAKTWKEADADVCEAADFCEYYAREAMTVGAGKPLLKVFGESNTYTYRPKGVGVVIAPWNFPLAIPMGMVTAALVTGNPVLFKPAGQALRMGEILIEVLTEAGIPEDVLHFLPGSGSEIGPVLTESPLSAFITFTGSMEVGTQIIEGAAKRRAGMEWVKRVVCEMGGKNALIIDEDADLDESVLSALYSAYGYQGQKCSALSRLIVLDPIYDRFMERFREAMQDLKTGRAIDPGSYLSAVIDRGAFEKISSIIASSRKEATRTTQAPLSQDIDPSGYFIPPTVFEGLPVDAEAARTEIFGPVVCAFRVKNLDEALKLANSVPFALTGGVFSRSPRNIEHVRNNLEAGNIYINRGITGAIVFRHPFGGYKLSGVGSKAGGPDYLYQFVDPVTVVENTMRRGFAPEVES